MWKALYPFQSHWHAASGVRQHYLDEGSGSPLLMVHGNPTWSFYWRNLIRAFRDEFRVVAPDHIGCGLSDKPAVYDYTLKQHTENLLSLVEQLDLRGATLLAHDWGGAIGLGAALRAPDRFARIILFNTGAFPPPFVPARIRACRIPGFGTLAIRGFNAFARAALSMAVRRPLAADVAAGLVAPYDSWRNRIATLRFVQDIPLTPRHPTCQQLARLEAGLPELQSLPTMMIWGMRDWCFRPECLERLLLSFPQADVHRLADAGHYVVEDAHETIVPLVRDFLRRTGSVPRIPQPAPTLDKSGCNPLR
jgi:haloalkane dehalogenase